MGMIMARGLVLAACLQQWPAHSMWNVTRCEVCIRMATSGQEQMETTCDCLHTEILRTSMQTTISPTVLVNSEDFDDSWIRPIVDKAETCTEICVALVQLLPCNRRLKKQKIKKRYAYNPGEDMVNECFYACFCFIDSKRRRSIEQVNACRVRIGRWYLKHSPKLLKQKVVTHSPIFTPMCELDGVEYQSSTPGPA